MRPSVNEFGRFLECREITNNEASCFSAIFSTGVMSSNGTNSFSRFMVISCGFFKDACGLVNK